MRQLTNDPSHRDRKGDSEYFIIPISFFLYMKIIYSEKIDKEIFKEINKMGDKLSPVFGFKFPKVKFDKREIPKAKIMANCFSSVVNENKIKKAIKKIYNCDMPDIIVYVNSTPFSTWNVKEKWLSVSIKRGAIQVENTICHEANHFMYDYVFKTEKYQDTEIKETLTVLNNFYGFEDKGWNKFSKYREKVFKFYKKTRDFNKTREYALKLVKSSIEK